MRARRRDRLPVLGAIVAGILGSGCYSVMDVPPSQVPKLAEMERGHTVVMQTEAGDRVEIDDYEVVRLFERGREQPIVELRPPTYARVWDGGVWFRRPRQAPLRVDPDEISHAEIVYRNGNRTFIVTSAIVAGAIAGGVAMPAIEEEQSAHDRCCSTPTQLLGAAVGAGLGAAVALPLTK